MNSRPGRLIALLVLLALGTTAGLLVEGAKHKKSSGTPVSAGPFSGGCIHDLPPKAASPTWLPKDLPLPPGTYASQILPGQGGVERAVFTVNASLDSFVKTVLNDWPGKGYSLTGKGDREAGEAEAPFRGPGKVSGLFRARAVYCDTQRIELLLAIARPTT